MRAVRYACFVAALLVAPLASRAAAQAPDHAVSRTEAEVDAILSDTATAETLERSTSPSLSIYGFADFSVSTVVRDTGHTIEGYFGETPAFSVGNFNVYAAADLTRGFKSLAEVRFTFLPNGAPDLGTGLRTSTAASDYTQLSQPTRWGGVLIERIWLEYQILASLSIRVGHWLTPVGIWNVDHGSPTILTAFRPYVVGANLFPVRQTGFELHGSHLFGETTLGYHLTLSNGRGNAETYADFDKNKAIGGRLYVSFEALGTLTLGVSAYYGRNTESDRIDVKGARGAYRLSPAISAQYDELAYAGDLLFKLAGLHVQLEVIATEGAYTERGRPRAPVIDGAGLVPDFRRWGGYLLIGYRLPWIGLMPLIDIEYMADGEAVTGGPASAGEILAVGGGFNLRPTPQVALKLGVYHGNVKGAGVPSAKFDSLTASVAWSF
ncbi:MAG: hypothetical protein ABW252_05630 [Polyangiales bacterium]